MRVLAVLVVLLVPAIASAQPGMTPASSEPYYGSQTQPTYTPPAPPPPAEPKVRLGVAIVAASPQGDWDQAMADTSPGFQLQLGFAVSPNISLFGGIRYVALRFQNEAQVPQDVNLSHRELALGLRYSSPMGPSSKFFIEGNIHSATVAIDSQGQTDSESGAGLGVRGGLTFMMSRSMGLTAALSYSAAEITPQDSSESFQDEWLAFDAGLDFFF
jgi:hypothetical protein